MRQGSELGEEVREVRSEGGGFPRAVPGQVPARSAPLPAGRFAGGGTHQGSGVWGD